MADAPLFGASAVSMQENYAAVNQMTAHKNDSHFALGMQDMNAGEGFVSKRNQYAVVEEKEDPRFPRKQEHRNPSQQDMYADSFRVAGKERIAQQE